ncbi:MAG TPA: response regulator [Gemmatimonadales bacterium]|nr:response regulator [Gemmatimonadales bacterium]
MHDGLLPLSPLAGSHAVLVVDDVAIVRRLATRLLSAAGYRIYEAASAREAIEVLELADGRLALVLVDALLPHVSGAELVREIRRRWPGVPAVLMSAHPRDSLVHDGLLSRDEPFLAKPFSRDELLGTVNDVLHAEWASKLRGNAEPPAGGRDGDQ